MSDFLGDEEKEVNALPVRSISLIIVDVYVSCKMLILAEGLFVTPVGIIAKSQ